MINGIEKKIFPRTELSTQFTAVVHGPIVWYSGDLDTAHKIALYFKNGEAFNFNIVSFWTFRPTAFTTALRALKSTVTFLNIFEYFN